MATIDENGLVLDTLDVFRQAARETIRNTIPEADLSDGADYDNLSEVMAADSFQHEFPIVYGVQQIFVATADTPYLLKHGNERRIPWPEAAASSGFFLLLGTNGSTQGAGSPVASQAGIDFTLSSATTIATAAWANKTVTAYDANYNNQLVLSNTTGMVAGDVFLMGGGLYCVKEVLSGSSILIYGKVLVTDPATVKGLTVSPQAGARAPIAAVDAGAAGNLSFYDQLTLSAPAAGITANGYVLEVSGGADKPTDEEYAILLQDVDSEYPAGGNRSQLLLWGKGYDSDAKTLVVLGVVRCFVYEVHRGLGTADIYPQGIARARHLSATKRTELQTFISPAAPTIDFPGKAAPGADIQILDFTDLPVDVSIAVQGGPGYGPDWSGTFTIDAVGISTTRIPLTADPTGTIVAGNRVALRIGVNLDLVLATVDTVDAGGVNLSAPLDSVPIAGETLYPGSSLIEPVRDAVLAMFDDLGPGDTTPPTRYPAPTTLYPANLDRALVIKTVRGVTGVNNLVLNNPAADVLPASAVQCVLGTLTITHLP